ncbi:MAG: dipeptidase, partial [bacterium]
SLVLTRKPINPLLIHQQSLVADLHCDSILDHIAGRRDITQETDGHIDIPKLFAGGVKVQVFAIFPDPHKIKAGEYERFVLRAVRVIRQICRSEQDRLGLALSPLAVKRLVKQGKIAVVIGVEGGHALEGNLDRIYRFWRAGVRVFTITWCNSNELADAGGDRNQPHQGVSPLGEKAIRIMNRLGMIIDVSHSAERAFYQILEHSQAPVIASHSGVYALRRHNRNLKNGQLTALVQHRGMMGQVFLPAFLNPVPTRASIRDVLSAIDYLVQKFGPEVVGLGSDYDGFSGRLPGLEDASRLPEITAGLVRLGYPDKGIKQILGLNFLRVWEEIWSQAKRQSKKVIRRRHYEANGDSGAFSRNGRCR